MVEMEPESSGANVKRTSSNLFVYFAIMQVVVIISTIFAVQRVQETQRQDLKELHSKLEEIFAERERKENHMRELALNGSMHLSSSDLPPLPPPKLPSLKVLLPADPETSAHSSAPAPVAISIPSPAVQPPSADHNDPDGGETKGFINGHGYKYREVESLEDSPRGEWDDGFDVDGNCSGALRLPAGGNLQHILMPDVEPMRDSRIWLLNVGAGTTGTRTVQREICKRQVGELLQFFFGGVMCCVCLSVRACMYVCVHTFVLLVRVECVFVCGVYVSIYVRGRLMIK
jgi:hypothetical protein